MAASIVTVYRNGDKNYAGKKLVLNRRQIRNFDAFLDKVTRDVKMKTAARAICTPTGGHRIKELDKIQTGGVYVAVGPENFKKLGYKDIREPKAVPRKIEEITPVRHSKLVMSGRARKVADAEATAHKVFFVFRNGDDLYPSRKMLLTKRDLSSMDKVLGIVTEKVRLQTGAVYCLCTMQGHQIKDPSELENNAQYVAVGHGKKFKKVAYSDHGAHIITPRRAVTKPRIVPHKKTAPNRTKAKSTSHKRRSSPSERRVMEDLQQAPPVQEMASAGATAEPLEVVEDDRAHQAVEELVREASAPLEDEVVEQTRKTSRQEPSEERVIESTEETVVGDEGIPLDDSLDRPNSGVYKASGQQKEDAGEIKDDKDTVEDKPIDQQLAEEVTEEQIDGDDNVQQNESRDSKQDDQ